MSAYPHLGFDPVASDESSGRAVATRLRTVVHRLEEADAIFTGSGDQAWQGQTAEAFRGTVDDELRPRVTEALESFGVASRALDGWVEALPGYRSRADALETEAREAVAAVDSAASSLAGIQEPGTDADDDARDAYDRDRTAARTALDRRRGEVEAVLARARSLREEVEQHASDVARAFTTAMNVAPDEPGLLGRIGEALQRIGEVLGEAFDWFMENLAPLIQKLAKVISALATILAIAAVIVGFLFFPLAPAAFALAATLSTVARVASLVDLGIQGLRVLNGEPGALQGFVVQGASMLAGMGMARALGPIATNANNNILAGPYRVAIAGISPGGAAGATATAVMHQTSDFYLSLTYWGITSARSLTGSLTTVEEELFS